MLWQVPTGNSVACTQLSRCQLKDKLELRQIRRTYILTFLAAIYLPFSFMTVSRSLTCSIYYLLMLLQSLYGMNLQDPLWGSVDSTSPPSTEARKQLIRKLDTTNDTSLFTQTEASNIITAIKGSGAHLWTLKSYWYTAIPVTVATILLPVVLGRLLRLTSQFIYPYVRHWRILLGLLVIAGSFLILTNRIAFTVYLSTIAGFFLALAFWRKKHRRFWAIYASGCIPCIALTWRVENGTVSFPSLFIVGFLLLYLVTGWYWSDAKLSVELLLQNLRGQWAPEENGQAVAEEGALVQTRSLSLERGPSVRIRRRAQSLN